MEPSHELASCSPVYETGASLSTLARQMETDPGLAPGKSGFADRRFDDFSMSARLG